MLIGRSFDPDSIFLSSDQIQQSAKLSSQIPTPSNQWSGYLHYLAFYGFKQWLSDYRHEFFSDDSCSVFPPSYFNFLPAIYPVNVGNFRLCILAKGTTSDDLISLPKMAIALPDFIAHFYLWISVDEEQGIVKIEGVIDYEKLRNALQEETILLEDDWSYDIPITWFEPSVETLLLYLRCLNPNSIAIPEESKESLIPLIRLKEQLSSLIAQLSNVSIPLWQTLTWQQAATIVTQPQLVEWLYNLQTQSTTDAELFKAKLKLAGIFEQLQQSVFKVSTWLQEQFNQVLDVLDWQLCPHPLYEGGSLRSISDFMGISPAFWQQQAQIPQLAKGAFREFSLGQYQFRLTAYFWIDQPQEEWTLFLLLGLADGQLLPQRLQFRVMSGTETLIMETILNDDQRSYLYAKVVGNLQETFEFMVSFNGGERFKQIFQL